MLLHTIRRFARQEIHSRSPCCINTMSHAYLHSSSDDREKATASLSPILGLLPEDGATIVG
jgi:hypothetical protein